MASFTNISDLSHTCHICMGLTCTEVKTEIRNSLRSCSVLPQQKLLPMSLLYKWGLELFE